MSGTSAGNKSEYNSSQLESGIGQRTPSDDQVSVHKKPVNSGEQPQNFGNWAFDANMEEKNPFSGFSEEHLSKLDEVLQSAGVQELLQQSGPDLGLLSLDQSDHLTATPISVSSDGEQPSTSAVHDGEDSLPESILSVVFSDHGYCMNPERAPKPAPATQPASKPVTLTQPVVVTLEPSSVDTQLSMLPTALLAGDSSSDAEQPDATTTDSSLSSPRKSGRAPARNKFADEDWVTGSPTKGRGRGRGVMLSSPFGLSQRNMLLTRTSTRISDQKQRDLAEKIMLANRQAMEAEKMQESTSDGTTSDASPVKSPGRGRGRGKAGQSPTSVGQRSPQDEDEDSVSEEMSDNEVEEEIEESESEKEEVQKKKKKLPKGKEKKKKKKMGKYEQDSDYSESDSDKKDKKKKKGKKKGSGKKGGNESEESDEEKGKKGKKKKEGNESEESDEEKGKKGKKKVLGKGKKKGKGKKNKKKGKGEKEDSDKSELSVEEDVSKKSPKAAKPKKLTKKERLKKLKEAKEAKKAKLLEKKKAKLKQNKMKGKKTGTETEMTQSDTSPKKKLGKVKKGTADATDESVKIDKKEQVKVSPKRGRCKDVDESKESPKVLAGKGTDSEKDKSDTAKSTAKMLNVTDTAEPKKIMTARAAKRKIAEGEVLTPDKKAKVQSENAENKQDTEKTISSPSRVDQNIFASLSLDLNAEASSTGKPSGTVDSSTVSGTDIPSKTLADSESTIQIDNSVKKVEGDVKVSQDSVSDLKAENESSVSNKDAGSGVEKTIEHHDKHRRHSHEHRDSTSSDRRGSHSHRRDSHGHDRRHSYDRDRRLSSSSSHREKDKDRHKDKHSRKDSETRDRDESSKTDKGVKKEKSKEEEKKEIKVSGKLGDVSKKVGKDKKVLSGKVKAKKSKKNDDLAIDSSMVDLFKPDNLPAVEKEEVIVKKEIKSVEKSIQKVKETKVKFQTDIAEKGVKGERASAESSKVKDEITRNVEIINVKELLSSQRKEELITSNEKKDEHEEKNVNKETEQVSVPTDKVENKTIEHLTNENDTNADAIRSEEEQMEVDSVGDIIIDSGSVDKIDDQSEVSSTSELADNEETKNDASEEKGENKELKQAEVKADERETLKQEEKTEKTDDTVDKKEQKSVEPEKRLTKPLNMADFFTERRLKINDPKPSKADKQKESPVPQSEASPSGRSKRNKAKGLAEILKKEKLGSDDEVEEEDCDDVDDDDEDFEDPTQLYCICRQPHNQRFMICCDKCEEWFHGKCVGISRARGAEMEKNNEEYVCPQCAGKQVVGKPGAGKTSADGTEASESMETVMESSDNSGSRTEQPVTQTDGTETTENKDKDVSTKTPQIRVIKMKKPDTSKSKTDQPMKKEPTAKAKKVDGSGTPKAASDEDLREKRKRVIKMVKEETEQKDKPKHSINMCFACDVKSPRRGSMYCSDECQEKHAKHNIPVGILKKKKSKKHERHIAVFERETGKTLTGDKAPQESELATWLQDNPTYEVLSHNRPAPKPLITPEKADSKSSLSASSKSAKSETSKSDKTSVGPEPIRLNVRSGLRDALAARAAKADDVLLSSSEIKSLALSIEEELFKFFKDTDSKYKAKYRSLVFNIKDPKNNGLFRKILNHRIRPSKLVRMSAEELASRELVQWREQETKHTLEMIKQVETENLKEPVHLTKKTHKGEVEVEEEAADLTVLADEVKPETAKTEQKPETENLPDTTDEHGKHLFDANCKICTGKLVPGPETTPSKSQIGKSEASSTKTVVTETPPEKELTKAEKDLQAEEVVMEVLKAIQRAKEDARKEELEFSGVTVRSPDSALSSGLDKNTKFTPIGPVLWKGFIYMQDVSKFVTTAYRVTGPVQHLALPDTITLCGRISPEHVWDYLNKMKQSATRDICVVRFIPGTNEEKAAYINLYSYLNSRSRCGVVENKDRMIKDFYIVPLASHSKIPSVLLPFDGPGLEENRCHMLLGVIIRNKVSRRDSSRSKSSETSKTGHHSRHHKTALKSALKDPMETSSESTEKSSASSSPKSSTGSTPQTSADKKKSISFDPIIKEYAHLNDPDESYTPGSDDPNDLNAPYDPENEAHKGPRAKKDKSSDAVSKMIEKIAQSKNPAEATAAMVAALATTTKFGNQRKLLLELTKKVDEQKKLLEQKRISAKLGQSPTASVSSPGQGVSQSQSQGQVAAPNSGLTSKDPRVRAQAAQALAAATSAAAAGNADVGDLEAMDIDLRDHSKHSSQSGTGNVSDNPIATTGTSQVTSSKLTTSMLKESVSSLLLLTSDITSSSGTKSSLQSSTDLVSKDSASGVGDKKESAVVPSIDATAQEEANIKYDIVTALQAEISGKSEKSVDTTKQEIKENRGEKSSSKDVPNVTSLFKNLGSQDSGSKSGINLPTALMSLFSKLPGSTEEPESNASKQIIPGLGESDEPTGTVSTETDTDLRSSEKEVTSVRKMSKSFLGFDYDSDSSSGSFEGFDDDGTKKLSPRKRRLVQNTSESTKVETDSVKPADVDLRHEARVESNKDEDLRTDPADIDHRPVLPLLPGVSQAMPFPPIMPLPFLAPNQPPPPGEEWAAPHVIPPPIPISMPQIPIPVCGTLTVPSESVTDIKGMIQPPPLPIDPPPLPAEPPKPKPPEPPVKKKKTEEDRNVEDNASEEEYMSRNKKKKLKKMKKKKGELLPSDERLNKIVLEIAKKKPMTPPPIPPAGTRLLPVPYSMAPTIHDTAPPAIMATPPFCGPPNIWVSNMGVTSWSPGTSMTQGLNTQAHFPPEIMPSHRQPPVLLPDPSCFGPAPPLPMPHGPPTGTQHGPPPGMQQKNPPSLLDLPLTLPRPTLKKNIGRLQSTSSSLVAYDSDESKDSVSTSALSLDVEPVSSIDTQSELVPALPSVSQTNTVTDIKDPSTLQHASESYDHHHRHSHSRSHSGERSHRSHSRDRDRRERDNRRRDRHGSYDRDHHRSRSRDRDSSERHHGGSHGWSHDRHGRDHGERRHHHGRHSRR